MNDRNQNNNPGLPNNSSNDDKNKAQNLSNNYLNSLKPSIGSQTNKWMLNLKEDLSKQLPDLLPSVNSQELKITHDVIANKIFDQLSKYAFEFSKDVANPEFKISTELPSRINLPHNVVTIPGSKANFGLQGHIYTRQWSLVIRSIPTKIKIYVVPTQYLIRLSATPDEFPAYIEFVYNPSHENWQIEGEELHLDVLSTIGKRLFAYYIQVIQGVCDGSEKFYLKGNKPDPVFVNREIADSGPAFLSPYENNNLLTSNLPPNVVSPTTYSGNANQPSHHLLSNAPSLPQSNMPQANMAQANMPQANMPQANMPQSNMAQANMPQANMPQSNMPQSNMAQANMPQSNMAQANMPQANMAQANMAQANMAQANMAQSNMPQANMLQSNMPQSNMAQSNMAQANMFGQNIPGQSMPVSPLTKSADVFVNTHNPNQEAMQQGQNSLQGQGAANVNGFSQGYQSVNPVNASAANNSRPNVTNVYAGVTGLNNIGQSGQSGHSLARLTEHSQMMFMAVESMNKELNLVINALTDITAEAMAAQDMVVAIKSLKCVNALKLQKEQFEKFTKEWNDIINS